VHVLPTRKVLDGQAAHKLFWRPNPESHVIQTLPLEQVAQ